MNNLFCGMCVAGGVGAFIFLLVTIFMVLDEFDKKAITVSLFITIALAAILCVGLYNYKDYYKIAQNKCLQSGYVQTYKAGDDYYCLLFGNEPKIYRLDDVNKP